MSNDNKLREAARELSGIAREVRISINFTELGLHDLGTKLFNAIMKVNALRASPTPVATEGGEKCTWHGKPFSMEPFCPNCMHLVSEHYPGSEICKYVGCSCRSLHDSPPLTMFTASSAFVDCSSPSRPAKEERRCKCGHTRLDHYPDSPCAICACEVYRPAPQPAAQSAEEGPCSQMNRDLLWDAAHYQAALEVVRMCAEALKCSNTTVELLKELQDDTDFYDGCVETEERNTTALAACEAIERIFIEGT
jgi:hypothetical protein